MLFEEHRLEAPFKMKSFILLKLATIALSSDEWINSDFISQEKKSSRKIQNNIKLWQYESHKTYKETILANLLALGFLLNFHVFNGSSQNTSYATVKSLNKDVATGGILEKIVFLEISQNSQDSTCARVSFLIKRLYLKRDSGIGVFL